MTRIVLIVQIQMSILHCNSNVHIVTYFNNKGPSGSLVGWQTISNEQLIALANFFLRFLKSPKLLVLIFSPIIATPTFLLQLKFFGRLR